MLENDEWLLPPLGIATRQSSDVLAIADPLVVAAVRIPSRGVPDGRVHEALRTATEPLAGLAQAVTCRGNLGKAARRIMPGFRLVRLAAARYGSAPSGE